MRYGNGYSGGFLQVELGDGEHILIRFEGRMAELLALIDPNLYRPHVKVENGCAVLYAERKKALYGKMKSALRFWEQVLSDITKLGFKLTIMISSWRTAL